MAAWFERWLEAEREALILRYWQPIIVPGLFQTADYARALLLTAQADTSDEAIDALVAVRLERRAIFDRPDPPNVVAVIDELVLHRLIGSPQVMHDQLTSLADLATRPYISVEVVPASAGANAGPAATSRVPPVGAVGIQPGHSRYPSRPPAADLMAATRGAGRGMRTSEGRAPRAPMA